MSNKLNSRYSRCASPILAAVGAVALATAAQAQVHSRALSLSGQAAPGTPSGTSYFSLDLAPTTNAPDQVGYLARLSGSGVGFNNDHAIYAGTADSPQLIAREDDLAHGTTGDTTYSLLSLPMINSAGYTTYSAQLAGSDTDPSNDSAIYTAFAGSPQLAAREGDLAPGTTEFHFAGFRNPVLTDAGEIAFHAFLRGSDGLLTSAIYAGTPDSLQPIARVGQKAPGTPSGVNYNTLLPPQMNDIGHVVYNASLYAPSDANEAIFGGAADSPQLIAIEGSQAPGTPEGTTYGSFSSLNAPQIATINDLGQIAFQTVLSGSVDAANNRAIYVSDSVGTPQLVVRTDDEAEGAPSGVKHYAPTMPSLNDVGQIAFRSLLTGSGVDSTNHSALFVGAVDSPQMIVRSGSQAPGTPEGTTYGGIRAEVTINDLGQVAYFAVVSGESVDTTNDVALFVHDPVMGDLLVAREGTPFDIGDGEFRTVDDAGISFSAGVNDDVNTGLSSDGRLLFALQFTDGSSGIFETVVPEPSSAGLLVLGLPTLLHRRRRRLA
jgi:hypothetical protein